jgi:hypothetical protein
MEVAADGPAPGEPCATRARPADLVRVGLSAATLFAAIGAVIGFADLLLSANDQFSDIAPFHGWQLWSMQGLFGAVLLAGLVVATRWARGRYRAVRDRTAYRRAIVLVVVVPALGLGGLVGQAAKPALSWASNHTSAAAKAQRQFAAFHRELQRAPLAAPVSSPLAGEGLAKRMLQPAYLGAGWYAATRPNPTSRTISADVAALGATARAASFVTQQHREGGLWSLDLSVLETETRLAGSGQVPGLLRHERNARSMCSCADPHAVMTKTTLQGVTVWEQVSANASSEQMWAAFALHNRVYTLLVYRWRTAPEEVSLTAPLRRAVALAAHPA